MTFTERPQTQEAADLWQALADKRQAIREAEAQRDELVRDLLQAGATWAHVGGALDISPQAAYKRYKERYGLCWSWNRVKGADLDGRPMTELGTVADE
jgi:hypothetical protein